MRVGRGGASGWGDVGLKEDQEVGWKMKGTGGLWRLNPLLPQRAGVPGADPQSCSEREKKRKKQPQTKRLDGLDGFPPQWGLSSALWGGGSLFMPEKPVIHPQKCSLFFWQGVSGGRLVLK